MRNHKAQKESKNEIADSPFFIMKMEVENLNEIEQELGELGKDMTRQAKWALTEAGRYVQSEAKLRCPIGPTKAQAKGTGYAYSKKKSPSTLRRSIIMRKGSDYVDVGVLSTGPAGKYADYIHFGEGKSWFKLGPANQPTGRKIGGLFLYRALDDNQDEINELFDKRLDVSIDRFNN